MRGCGPTTGQDKVLAFSTKCPRFRRADAEQRHAERCICGVLYNLPVRSTGLRWHLGQKLTIPGGPSRGRHERLAGGQSGHADHSLSHFKSILVGFGGRAYLEMALTSPCNAQKLHVVTQEVRSSRSSSEFAYTIRHGLGETRCTHRCGGHSSCLPTLAASS